MTVARFLRVKKLQAFLPILFGINRKQNSILLKTSVNLDTLLEETSTTEISHDAGKFVCEGLYYEVLNHLRQRNGNCHCIFVHVPLLTPDNSHSIVADFQQIIEKIVTLANHSESEHVSVLTTAAVPSSKKAKQEIDKTQSPTIR